MSFKENIQKLSVQVMERKKHITNEEMTKQALIIPFLQVLGFDVFNPLEVKSEYDADFGKKKGEKVDYAIFKEDMPIMFIEAKSVNENLENHDAQLSRYFNATPNVKLAVLTNGMQYKFFTDLKSNNMMDEDPFIQLDITNLSDNDIEVLSKFRKESFEKDELLKYAEDIIYTSTLNSKLRELFRNPSDDFVRYLIKDFSDTRITANVVDRFRPIVKKAISNAVLDIVSQGLLQQGGDAEEIKSEESQPEDNCTHKPKKEIITTEEELSGFNVVKEILAEAGKDVSEVNYRDTTAYFGIFIKNALNWIVRFNFDSSKGKHVLIKLPLERSRMLSNNFNCETAPKGHGESRIYINSINDLKDLKELLVECFDIAQ